MSDLEIKKPGPRDRAGVLKAPGMFSVRLTDVKNTCF